MENTEKTMGVNPDRRPEVEPRMRLAVNIHNFPANPATRQTPNVMHCILLDIFGMVYVADGLHTPSAV